MPPGVLATPLVPRPLVPRPLVPRPPVPRPPVPLPVPAFREHLTDQRITWLGRELKKGGLEGDMAAPDPDPARHLHRPDLPAALNPSRLRAQHPVRGRRKNLYV